MKFFRCSPCRILLCFVLAALLSALWISWQRNQAERASDTVEMVYDYDNVMDTAALENTTPGQLFDLYRKSGITSLAVYEETPKKLAAHGELSILQGSDFAARRQIPGYQADPGKIYIQPTAKGDSSLLFRETENALKLRIGESRVRVLTDADGTETMEVSADYSRFLDLSLGIYPSQVKNVTDRGFYAVLRPINVPHAGQAVVDQFLRAADASPGVSAVLFEGKQVLGYQKEAAYLTEQLNRRGIPVVLIESQSQLQFEKQDGILDMVKNMNYRTVRLYAMSKDELVKINQEEAASRFYISDIERNIRMNLFPSYKVPMNGDSLSETNAKYIADVTERLNEHGFRTGRASVITPYFPSAFLRAVVMAGAVSLLCITLLQLLPRIGQWIWAIWAAAAVFTQILFWETHSVLPLQMLALGTAVCIPVLTVSLFLEYCLYRKRKVTEAPGWGRTALEGTAVLWAAGGLSLLGAMLISGLLGDIRFFLEMEIFRGVKLTFVLPLILVTCIYIQKFPFFGKTVASGSDLWQFLRRFSRIPVKLGTAGILLLIGVVSYIYVGRSGHTEGVSVPGIEIQLRRFLEVTMYARPREKEFLIGHPALFLSLAALYRKWPQILHYFLILGVTIGQGSMVETFAHMRSPVMLSFVRGLDGLAAGTAAGFLAIAGVMILVQITRFLGERYGRP